MAKRRASRIGKEPEPDRPTVFVISGPNGAGKSTAAPRLLNEAAGLVEFLNADLIARGISPFDPDRAALEASGIMLMRMEALAAKQVSFGLESTLAARSLAPRLRDLVARGYEFHLVFLYLPSADLAVARVADRVRLGGHNVPEQTVRRRYEAGLRNFFRLYQPLATTWRMFDNAHAGRMLPIASGRGIHVERVVRRRLWNTIERKYRS